MSLKFNPPKEEAKKLPRYASYAAGVMKTHAGIGPAKNSLNNRMWQWAGSRENGDRRRVTTYAAILEKIGGTWWTLYDIPEGTTYDNLPWMKEVYRDSWGGWNLVTDFVRNNSYYQKRFAEGELKIIKRPYAMTTEEYIEFRLKVAREIWESEK